MGSRLPPRLLAGEGERAQECAGPIVLTSGSGDMGLVGGEWRSGGAEEPGTVDEGLQEPGAEVTREVGEGEAAPHPDTEAGGGGPLRADLADDGRRGRVGDLCADPGLEQAPEGPQAE